MDKLTLLASTNWIVGRPAKRWS